MRTWRRERRDLSSGWTCSGVLGGLDVEGRLERQLGGGELTSFHGGWGGLLGLESRI